MKNCYLYILDTLSDWEIGYITAEIASGRFLDRNKEEVSLIKVGSSLEPITTMGGVVITPDKDIKDVNFKDGDILILPGADDWTNIKNNKVLDIVQSLLDRNVIIAAICGATIALANRGFLNNREHTSNDLSYLKMICPNYIGETLYKEQPAVTDGNLITATGFAPLEFSYELFKTSEIMRKDTLEAWFQLYKTKESKYFYDLMQSLQQGTDQ